MKWGNRSIVLILIGSLFLLAAFGFWQVNEAESRRAGETAATVLAQVENIIATRSLTPKEEPVQNSEMEFVTVDGLMGTLELPSLEMEFPIQSEYSLWALETAPCRYQGENGEVERLVICGHNYKTHFGKLKEMPVGEEIIITNMDGTKYTFSINNIKIISAADFDAFQTGEWDMALFTCTVGAINRIVLFCQRI